MLCQWWLLGVRIEARDHVPGWVQLMFPTVVVMGHFLFFSYPQHFPKTTAAFLCICYNRCCCLFNVCIELSRKCTILCNTTYLCISCKSDAIGKKQLKIREVRLFWLCIHPTIVPCSASDCSVQSRRGCLEKQREKINWQKQVIWLPHIWPHSFQGEVALKEVKHQ